MLKPSFQLSPLSNTKRLWYIKKFFTLHCSHNNFTPFSSELFFLQFKFKVRLDSPLFLKLPDICNRSTLIEYANQLPGNPYPYHKCNIIQS